MQDASSAARQIGSDLKSNRCVFYIVGILISLSIYGLLQERIMSVPYRDNLSGISELFALSVFLVFCNRVFAVVYALIAIGVLGESYQSACPLWKYMVVSLSNVGASSCQYEALRWVSFPVLLLGKTFKILPVMLWGAVIAGHKYSGSDWAVATLVTWGVAQFLTTGHISAHVSAPTSSSYQGLLLLLAFLVLDSFTCSLQEHVFKEHKTSKYNQMLYVNLGSSLTSLTILLVTGQFRQAILFTFQHAAFAHDVAGLSGAAIASQWFIYSMVQEFGAVALAATMNVRQVMSTIFSYHAYDHPISRLQLMALGIIFTAILCKSYWGLATKLKGNKWEHQPLNGAKPSDPKV